MTGGRGEACQTILFRGTHLTLSGANTHFIRGTQLLHLGYPGTHFIRITYPLVSSEGWPPIFDFIRDTHPLHQGHPLTSSEGCPPLMSSGAPARFIRNTHHFRPGQPLTSSGAPTYFTRGSHSPHQGHPLTSLTHSLYIYEIE